MTFLLLLAPALLQTPDPLARFAAFQKAHPEFQVRFEASLGKSKIAGTLKVARPNLLLYRAKGGQSDFSLSETPKQYLEIEYANRVYAESPPPGRIALQGSDIDPFARFMLPWFELLPNLHGMFPSKPDVTASGGSDVVHAKGSRMGVTTDVWATIDGAGKLLALRSRSVGMGGTRDITWTIQDYSSPTDVSLKSFSTPIPLGYVPYSIPELPDPLAIGKQAPTAGWMLDGKKIDLAEESGHKPFLLILSRPDSAPGVSAIKWSGILKGKLPVFVAAQGGLTDPGGSRIKVLSPPGSPMFYLIDGKGKVMKLWLGFDPGDAAAFEKDVLTSSEAPERAPAANQRAIKPKPAAAKAP